MAGGCRDTKTPMRRFLGCPSASSICRGPRYSVETCSPRRTPSRCPAAARSNRFLCCRIFRAARPSRRRVFQVVARAGEHRSRLSRDRTVSATGRSCERPRPRRDAGLRCLPKQRPFRVTAFHLRQAPPPAGRLQAGPPQLAAPSRALRRILGQAAADHAIHLGAKSGCVESAEGRLPVKTSCRTTPSA